MWPMTHSRWLYPRILNQPLEQRDVGGLGIYFSRRSVDEFRYERIADRNRNIFVMNRIQHAKNLTDLDQSTILVAGNPQASEILLDYLKQSGYITLSASAASDVLQIVSLQRVDLILMSMKVDEMAALLRLLKAAPTLWSIPVVACAQSGDQTTPLVEAGADDIVIGAFVPEFFDMRLRIALAHKKRADEHAAYVRQLEELSNDLRTVILPLGIALTMEKDLNRLLEKIVLEAKGLCNADGGTLYLNTPDNTLRFTIMHTTSLKIAMGGTTGISIPIPPLRMYDATGAPNYANVTTSVALTHQSVNIPDIYNAEDYDFSATREFDERNGYRSISSLAVPLMNNDGEIVGVLQLLNAIDPETGQVISFDSCIINYWSKCSRRRQRWPSTTRSWSNARKNCSNWSAMFRSDGKFSKGFCPKVCHSRKTGRSQLILIRRAKCPAIFMMLSLSEMIGLG